jgi:NlpC/P60 family
MSDELARSVELLERLLGDPELRRRFRRDAASVLVEAGLPELAAGLGHGGRALMTLEMRESRSSLAGVMVAAAAEGVDLAQFAEHAAPAVAHDAGAALSHLVEQPHHPAARPVHESAAQVPQKPNFDPPAETPSLAQPASPAPAPSHAAPVPAPAPAPAGAAGQPAPAAPAHAEGASSAPRAASQSPSQGARLVTEPAGSHHRAAIPNPVTPGAADGGPAYPGDTATPQQIAAWMGAHAQRAGLPPELPVMAALTESGLRNLSYGDRDSVGFFQMRLGIWDQGTYAGYPSNPQLQIQWFIDHALAVKAQYPGLAESPNTWGELVADVEQPAAEYRYRYQLQLQSAQDLLRGADLTSGAAATPAAAAPPAPPPVPVGQAALKVAMDLTGGGGHGGASLQSGPTSAELVQYAYAQQGVQLPGAASLQYDVGIPVAHEHLKPGDAVFFAQRDGYVDHVGLYVGDGRFISAAERGGGVRVSSIADPPLSTHYIGARRYTAAALGNPSSYARPLPTIKR